MAASRRLRIKSNEGFPEKEYRVVDGHVEARSLAPEGEFDRQVEDAWSTLTPDQLSLHVERNTVVAKWLEHRLGWRNLLRACVGEEVCTDVRDRGPFTEKESAHS
ncbi:MAG: hypothetical protein ACRD20_17405 [Terriglobales bacterium]